MGQIIQELNCKMLQKFWFLKIYDDESDDCDHRYDKIEPANVVTEREWEKLFSLYDYFATYPPVNGDDIVNVLVEDACASDFEYGFVGEPVIIQGTEFLYMKQLRSYLCSNGFSYWYAFHTIEDFSTRPFCTTHTKITSYFCN